MSVLIDLTGQRFGRLIVIERVNDTLDKSGRKYSTWKCQCDCGNYTNATTNNLRSGNTKSCGCYHKEKLKNGKHGYRNTRIYSICNSMKQRCNNKNNVEYKNYGGRGIKVCAEWNKPDGLKNFAEWSIKNGYKENLTLDRINVNGNYEPSNCRWIPLEEQFKNMRKNVYVEYNGEKMIIADFSRRTGIDHRKVSRYLKNGYSIEEILEKELKK